MQAKAGAWRAAAEHQACLLDGECAQKENEVIAWLISTRLLQIVFQIACLAYATSGAAEAF